MPAGIEMRRVLAVPLIAAATVVAVGARQTPVRDAVGDRPPLRGTASIAGKVVTGDPAQPVRRVTVTVIAASQTFGGRVAVTDDEGRFAVGGLPPGRYLVTASKAAYVPTAYGVTKALRPGAVPTGTAVSLREGQHATDLVLHLSRGAVVTGVVRGTDGSGARSVLVTVLYYRRSPLTGERILASVPGGSVTTDGRGVYRVFGLPPGEYVVGASPGSGRDIEITTDADVAGALDLVTGVRPGGVVPPTPVPPIPVPRRPTVGFATVFYPSAVDPSQATPITVRPGEERTGVDLTLRLVPNSIVEGTVTGIDGGVASGLTVQLSGEAFGTAVAGDSDGRFDIRGVPPGSYTLSVIPAPTDSGGTSFWARTSVMVVEGRDVTARLALQPAFTLTGRVVIDAEATSPAPDLAPMRVALAVEQSGGGLNAASVKTDGTFGISGVVPGRFRLSVIDVQRLQPVQTWHIKSATLKGSDALDRGVDIAAGDDLTNAVVTITNRVSALSGTMVDASGRPAPEYFVIVFPADRALWSWNSRRIRQTRPANDGTFAFQNLPAGEYLLGAVTDVEHSEWFEPAFLEALTGASVRVALADGEKKTQNVRVR